MSSITGRLFVVFQYLLPRKLLTSLVFRLARIESQGFKNFLIRRFVSLYNIDISELDKTVPDNYPSLNAFFTRELAAGSRPISGDLNSVVSPVDGTVSAAGPIEDDMVFQAKGRRYSLGDLLAADLQDVDTYRNGLFTTIYLAPYNYHRVHAPLGGRLHTARYVPGDLFSVNGATATHMDALFARNERLVCHFDGEHGPYVLVFVGALNVGSITTPWTGEIRPRTSGVPEDIALDDSAASLNVSAGDLLGWFNMGSTVIVLLPQQSAAWNSSLEGGATVRMGELIGSRIDA